MREQLAALYGPSLRLTEARVRPARSAAGSTKALVSDSGGRGKGDDDGEGGGNEGEGEDDEEGDDEEEAEEEQEDEKQSDRAEEAYAFRLFAKPARPDASHPSARPASAHTNIVLLEDDGDSAAGDGAFLVAERDRGHYFWAETRYLALRQAQCAFVAVTGEDVRREARRRWWGMEVPWRVRIVRGPRLRRSREKNGGPTTEVRIGAYGLQPGGDAAAATVAKDDCADVDMGGMAEARAGPGASTTSSRKQPNKKRRILLRKRAREQMGRAEEEERRREGREVAEREKKTRLNKAKQARKRAREKMERAEKAAGREVGALEGEGRGAGVGAGGDIGGG